MLLKRRFIRLKFAGIYRFTVISLVYFCLLLKGVSSIILSFFSFEGEKKPHQKLKRFFYPTSPK